MIPTNGLGLLGVSDIILNSKKLDANITQAVVDAVLGRTIEGASSITVTIADAKRDLLRSGIFKTRITCELDKLQFELVKVEKQQDRIITVFEALSIAKLRRATGPIAAAAGTTTRTGFAARLVSQVPGVVFNGYTDPVVSKVPFARGSSSTPTEDSWTALCRLASEVGWRCFESAGTVWFGPDSWLLSQKSLGTIRENTGGINNIDFDADAGKPVQTAKVSCTAAAWAFPPGQPVTIAGLGIADGTKLVQKITRSLFYDEAKVDLVAAQPVIPAPTQ